QKQSETATKTTRQILSCIKEYYLPLLRQQVFAECARPQMYDLMYLSGVVSTVSMFVQSKEETTLVNEAWIRNLLRECILPWNEGKHVWSLILKGWKYELLAATAESSMDNNVSALLEGLPIVELVCTDMMRVPSFQYCLHCDFMIHMLQLIAICLDKIPNITSSLCQLLQASQLTYALAKILLQITSKFFHFRLVRFFFFCMILFNKHI
ncbi:hypothetical protein RFI_25634, partial [Reticulomyxa filosa]